MADQETTESTEAPAATDTPSAAEMADAPEATTPTTASTEKSTAKSTEKSAGKSAEKSTTRGAKAVAEPLLGARAQARYSHIGPRKARRVIDLVRGMKATDALDVLRFTPQSASEDVYKVLASAMANAEHNEHLDRDALWVSEAYVDEGPTLKRFRPRAQGRAYRVRKRTSHITVVVEAREQTPRGQRATTSSRRAR